MGQRRRRYPRRRTVGSGVLTSAVAVDANIGDTMTCPGCGEKLRLDQGDGWTNRNGFTCTPLPGRAYGVHTDHITTSMSVEES